LFWFLPRSFVSLVHLRNDMKLYTSFGAV
jgi:hypothetical protein